jgi:hypothetical protein
MCLSMKSSYCADLTWYRSYRSQFYTLRTNGLNGGSSTSRTVTILYTTTTIFVSATASADADLSFLSSSLALTEPTDVTVPLTPTPGALVVGACTTSTRAQTSDVVCQTLTADGVLFTAGVSGDPAPRSVAVSLSPGNSSTFYAVFLLSCLMVIT